VDVDGEATIRGATGEVVSWTGVSQTFLGKEKQMFNHKSNI
jgi:hypothetical protein